MLIPSEIVEEEGRLPLKRGPKALQQNGMPFYHLTKKGMIVSLAIDNISERRKILKDIVVKADDDEKTGISDYGKTCQDCSTLRFLNF